MRQNARAPGAAASYAAPRRRNPRPALGFTEADLIWFVVGVDEMYRMHACVQVVPVCFVAAAGGGARHWVPWTRLRRLHAAPAVARVQGCVGARPRRHAQACGVSLWRGCLLRWRGLLLFSYTCAVPMRVAVTVGKGCRHAVWHLCRRVHIGSAAACMPVGGACILHWPMRPMRWVFVMSAAARKRASGCFDFTGRCLVGQLAVVAAWCVWHRQCHCQRHTCGFGLLHFVACRTLASAPPCMRCDDTNHILFRSARSPCIRGP